MITRHDLARQLSTFVRGESSLEELRRWMTQVLVPAEVPSPSEDRLLVARIAFLIEDESLNEDEHCALAGALSRVLQGPLPSERVLAAIPLLAKGERLHSVIQAVEAGKMTRTSFLSFVAESRLSTPVKQWLTRASTNQVRELSMALQCGALEKVERLLSERE